MKKSITSLTLCLVSAISVLAADFFPAPDVPCQIANANGNLLTWDGSKLRAIAEGSGAQNIFLIPIEATPQEPVEGEETIAGEADDTQWYNIVFDGVEGCLAAKTASGWTATISADFDSDLSAFTFVPSESTENYLNIVCKGVTRGGKMLGLDLGETEVFTDKSDNERAAWAILPLPDPNPNVESITVTPAQAEINANESVQLSAQVVTDSEHVRISWTTSNPTVATVSGNGLVVGKGAGIATITASCGDKSAECRVTVIGVDAYAEYELPDDDIRKNAYEGYKLVFAEEFSVDGEPDYSIWNLEDGYKRNNEDQYYVNPNSTMGKALGITPATIHDGMLVIEARHDDLPNPLYGQYGQKETIPYTSASLQTKGSSNGGYSWLFGIYEVRAKITCEKGLWPAIWSTGMQYEWPYGGEIDIMEYYNDRIHANVCWGGRNRWSGVWNSKTITISSLGGDTWDDDFHIWRMYWDYDYMELWVDDICVNRINLDTTVNYNPGQSWYNKDNVNPFRDVRQMGWVNLALGGNNGGSLANTTFPSYYMIDYFRVYQKIGTDGKAKYHVDETISDPWGIPIDGIEDVKVDAIDNTAPIEFFDLSGRKVRVSDDTHGLFIRRQGSQATKIIL